MSALSDLLESGKNYKRVKGQMVQSFDDKPLIILVKSGYIKRYLISNEGTLGVQSVYGPGFVFPLTAAFLSLFNQKIYEGTEKYYYEAMTDSELCSITTETLTEAASSNPILYKEILFQAGTRLQSNIQQLENISLKTPYRRVAHQLVFFARHFNESTEEGQRILVPLTHQDLADILNVTRETVSREIGKLREAGLIASEKHIVVPDIERLVAAYE